MSRNRNQPGWPTRFRGLGQRLRVRWDRWRHRAKATRPAAAEDGGPPLAGRFCPAPFQQVDLEESGTCYTCCSSWLPTPMGNVRHAGLAELWNGPIMRKIRESIYDGSFRYCRHDRCPIIQGDELPSLAEAEAHPVYGEAVKARATELDSLPSVVNMVNDRSCNLACPSCRPERIQVTEGRAFERLADIQARFLDAWLHVPNERDFTLSITGSGDPFASRVYRELLYGLDGRDYPNMKIALQTNGVLLTSRNWERMARLHDNIATVIVSMDAATPETYAVTRRGGHWETLMANCERLGELRRAGDIAQLRYDFVVQQANYREMPAFVDLARRLGGDRAYFSRLVDWGTWPRETFEEQCPWRPRHPERDAFFQVLADPVLDDPFVALGNLGDLRRAALRRGLAGEPSGTIRGLGA